MPQPQSSKQPSQSKQNFAACANLYRAKYHKNHNVKLNNQKNNIKAKVKYDFKANQQKQLKSNTRNLRTKGMQKPRAYKK